MALAEPWNMHCLCVFRLILLLQLSSFHLTAHKPWERLLHRPYITMLICIPTWSTFTNSYFPAIEKPISFYPSLCQVLTQYSSASFSIYFLQLWTELLWVSSMCSFKYKYVRPPYPAAFDVGQPVRLRFPASTIWSYGKWFFSVWDTWIWPVVINRDSLLCLGCRGN